MDKNKQIESINRKYTELTSKAWNDNNISLNQIFDEVLPKLKDEKQEEIEKLKTKKNQ